MPVQSSFVAADRKPDTASALSGAPVKPAGKRDGMSLGRSPKAASAPSAAEKLPAEIKSAFDALRGGDFYKAQDAQKKLVAAAKAGDPNLAAAIGDLLMDKKVDRSMAGRYIETLQQCGTPQAAEQLARATGHPDYSNVAGNAQSALNRMGKNGVDAALEAWTKAPDEQRRSLLHVLTGSTGMKEPRAQAALIEAAGSKNRYLATQAGEALAKDSGVKEAYAQNPAFRHEALKAMTDAALKHPDKEARRGQASSLHDMVKANPSDPANMEALGRLAKSKDYDVAGTVAETYADSGIIDTINKDPKLQAQALKDLKAVSGTLESWGQSDRADRAMGRLESKEARQHLLHLADSSNASTRKAALEGLKQSGDPSVTDVLLRKALKDPSHEVRGAAMGALRDLQWAGDESAKIANFQKLTEAAKKAKGEDKTDLEHAAKLLREKIGATSFGYEPLMKAWEGNDKKAVAEALTKAGGADLRLFEAQLKTKGQTLPGLLEDLRTSNPEGHGKVLDAFTSQIGGKYVYANVSDESTKVYRDALAQHLKGAPDETMRAYVDRNFKQGPTRWGDTARASVDVLGAVGDDRSLRMLIHAGPSAAESTREQLKEAVKNRPTEQVDRVGLEFLNAVPGVSLQKDLAAAAIARNGSAAAKQVAGEYFAKSIETKGPELKAYVERMNVAQKEDAKQLNELYKLRYLSDKDGDLLPYDARRRLDKDISSLEGTMHKRVQHHEDKAREITSILGDPDAKVALAALPPERIEAAMTKAVDGISGTQAAREYVDRHLAPAIEDPTKDPLMKTVFRGSNTGWGVGLKVMEKLAPELALKGEAVWQKGLQQALGLKTAGEVGKMEKALIDLAGDNATKAAKAKETLQGMGFRSGYNQLGATFATLNFAAGVRDLVGDPTWRKALSTAKDTAELTEKLTILAENSPRLANAGKLVGKVAYPLTAVMGFMDLQDSAANRDIGGTVFDSLTATGGIVATAGLVLDGTVVGAVAGVPLTVIGGAMAGVGAVGKWIFGDSKGERFAKKLGYL